MKGLFAIVATPVIPMVFGATSEVVWGQAWAGMGFALGLFVVVTMWLKVAN